MKKAILLGLMVINTEMSLTFTYTLSGLEKGKYKIITQVSDMHSAKKASIEKGFAIE